jgi:hypothetical protein
MAKRACKGTTTKGKPCGAVPLKPGTLIDGVTVTGEWCRQHDLNLPDSARIGGATQGAGRPPKPRVIDVILASITERAGEIDAGLWEATKAERGVVVGSGENAALEMVPDWPTRLAAYRELMDRGHGRPRQVAEVTVINDALLEQKVREWEAAADERDRERGSAGSVAGADGPRGAGATEA